MLFLEKVVKEVSGWEGGGREREREREREEEKERERESVCVWGGGVLGSSVTLIGEGRGRG